MQHLHLSDNWVYPRQEKAEATPYDGYCQVYFELDLQDTRCPTL